MLSGYHWLLLGLGAFLTPLAWRRQRVPCCCVLGVGGNWGAAGVSTPQELPGLGGVRVHRPWL